MNRRILILAAAAAALAGAAWWYFGARRTDTGPLTLYGNVEVRQVNLAFKVSGRISKLYADEGDHVTEGKTLAELDRVYFEESLAEIVAQRNQSAANLSKLEGGNRPEDIAQAEEAVKEREASLANANQTYARATDLLARGAGTRKTRDDAFAAREEAKARLASARQASQMMRAGFRKEDVLLARTQLAEREAAVKVAQRQLSDAVLKAPSDGVVLTRVREVGAIVNAGETAFVLSLTTPTWVRGYVSETELGRVKPGMEVELSADSAAIPHLGGKIGFISSTAEFTPKTVETRELRTALVYRLRVVVDDKDGVLRQGMPITITIPPAGQK